MSERKFIEPTRFTRFLDFLWFSGVWFLLAAIGYYQGDPYAIRFLAFAWFTVLLNMVVENRDTLDQARKEIAELKEMIKTKQ